MPGINLAAHHNELGYVHWRRMEVDAAIRHFRKALKLDPANLSFRHNLGQMLLLRGNYAAGFQEFEARKSAYDPPDQPRYMGQQLNGQLVVVSGEQGYGDQIQFARYIPMMKARGARVMLAVPQPLQRLLATVEGVDGILTSPDQLPPRFYFQWIMSLPSIFGTTLDTVPAAIPYIGATAAPFLSSLPGLRIGLCWAGRAYTSESGAEMDSRRSMRLADLAPLLAVPGCSFVSLQLGKPAGQLRDFPIIHNIADRLTDWADTAELVAGLDLVISVDTSVVHLAGALGRPVWLLNRFDSCWRWLADRSDSPWYPLTRVYRQPKPGVWGKVVADVTRDLATIATRLSYVRQHPAGTSLQTPPSIPYTSPTGPADEHRFALL